jgi:hypothetical protein
VVPHAGYAAPYAALLHDGYAARNASVTSQDFIKFWGKFFAFVMLETIENSQGFKTF